MKGNKDCVIIGKYQLDKRFDKMKIEDFGKELEQIENKFVKIWNNKYSPNWMVRDANTERNKAVGELLKKSRGVVKDENR